jgi:hypothetical protein
MEIKGLKEKLGVTDEQIDHLRDLRIATEMRQAMLMMNIWKRGGNIHSSNPETVASNRKKNKAARKARRANR